MDAGKTRYVPGKGTPELQKAIQSKFLKDNNLNYDLDEIIVGVGGKHIIYNAMMATINPNDEVIIPAPFWVSYPDIVLLAEGKPVIVQCPENQNFKITADQLEKSITDKTKWLMLNSPSNPTGSLYSKQELKELAEVLLKYPQVLIMADDIYEKVIYDNLEFTTIASVEPKSTCHANLASSPLTMLSLLLVESLDTITANNSPWPHLSSAALVAVILLEKSPIMEPYKSDP